MEEEYEDMFPFYKWYYRRHNLRGKIRLLYRWNIVKIECYIRDFIQRARSGFKPDVWE